jgi:hypothetical protein
MNEPITPGNKFDGLRQAASLVGNFLFAAGKAVLSTAAKDIYACEWNIDDILRIRKIKQADGKPGWIVFDFNHAEKDAVRLTFEGRWEQRPHGNSSHRDYVAQWRDDTEFDTFEEAAAMAADVIKHGPTQGPGGKG